MKWSAVMKIVPMFEQILSTSVIRNMWRTVRRILFMFMLGLLGLKQVRVIKQVAILYSQFSVGRVLANKNCQSITVNRTSIKAASVYCIGAFFSLITWSPENSEELTMNIFFSVRRPDLTFVMAINFWYIIVTRCSWWNERFQSIE